MTSRTRATLSAHSQQLECPIGPSRVSDADGEHENTFRTRPRLRSSGEVIEKISNHFSSLETQTAARDDYPRRPDSEQSSGYSSSPAAETRMSPSSSRANYRKCQPQSITMIPRLLSLVVVLISIGAGQRTIVTCQSSGAGPASSLAGRQPGRERTSSNLDGGDLQQSANNNNFVDLVAIGGITLLDPSTAAEQPNQNRLLFSNHNSRPRKAPTATSLASNTGRLVDRIAAPLQQTQQQLPNNNDEAPQNKLDYIIDFMRANKLTKFCDLLTSQDGEVLDLIKHLNSLEQFTLFVPTNEALLLTPTFENIKRSPLETKQFLMTHSTSELVVPNQLAAATHERLANQQRWSSGRTVERIQTPNVDLIFSLAGNPLRIATAPIAPGGQLNQNGTKLELIVNGANVLSGHSHALQEPLNSSATYAIVHLIDRSLYPPPSVNLLDKIRQLAPKMASYILGTRDQQLINQLESSKYLTTAVVPNDDAFLATPSKLLEQLDTNRTFLNRFVRSHLIDGIYFSGQLSGSSSIGSSANNQAAALSSILLGNQSNANSSRTATRQLTSLAGLELEFDTKSLQSRQVILVNSIPLLEIDAMALNGVVHTLARPMFERQYLEACHCSAGSGDFASPTRDENNNNNSRSNQSNKFNWPNDIATTNNNRLDLAYELESNPSGTPASRAQTSSVSYDPTASWFARGGTSSAPVGSSNELEREESRIDSNSQQQAEPNSMRPSNGQQRTRSQRSGGLVARNNRDFYRPSIDRPSESQVASGERTNSSWSSAGQQEAQSGRLTSASPNVTAAASQQQQLTNARRGSPPSNTMDPIESIINNGQLFEVERYKVVLNATSRQKMREQQQFQRANLTQTNQQQQQLAPLQAASSRSKKQFIYDQPLPTQNSRDLGLPQPATNESLGRLRQYSQLAPTNSPSSNDQVLAAASQTNTNRQQRLLKFQPDDAVDRPFGIQMASARLQSSHSNHSSRLVAPPQSQQTTKSMGFSGCAFYDTECKRLVGKLVRLPPSQPSDRKIFMKQQQQFPQPTSYIQPSNGSFPQQFSGQSASTLAGNQHLDSTFGETTESPLGFGRLQLPATTRLPAGQLAASPSSSSAKQLLGAADLSRLNPQPARISPLNQPLPPWSPDEISSVVSPSQRLVQTDQPRPALSSQLNNWRQQDVLANDLTRIRSDQNLLFNQQQQQQQPAATRTNMPSAQILLVPVKMFQDAGITVSANQQFNMTQPQPTVRQQQQMSNLTTIDRPQAVLFAQQQQQTTSRPARFNVPTSQGTFYTPTIRSETNFSSFEPALEGGTVNNANPTSSFALNQQQSQRQTLAIKLRSQQINQQQPMRKSPIQIMNDKLAANEPPGAAFQPDSIKQARKLVRQQQLNLKSPMSQQDEQQAYVSPSGGGGDISITSARLTQPRPFNYTFNGLATQASNQAPNSVSSANQFVRSVGLLPSAEAGELNVAGDVSGNNNLIPADQVLRQQQANAAAADFFQNRTIGEIMDDSGLRIDGQQVTFTRLKDCLVQADLLSLVTQTSSSLTIFMPTDLAFQRLIQQQAILHQRERSSRATGGGGGGPTSSRKYLLPLVAKNPTTASPTSDKQQLLARLTSPAAPTATSGNQLATSASSNVNQLSDPSTASSNVAQRLNLDCSSSQVRQLLLDHLSAQLITPKQLTNDLALGSLSGKQLLLSSVPSKKIVVVDGQPVIAATRAKNGMVYVVNKLLNLTHQASNVVELVENQPNLSTFYSYLTFSSLADRFKRETGPITILAPTNEAFEQLSTAARQLINSDPSALADILRGHVVDGAQFGKLVSMRSKLKTMNSDQTIEARVIRPNIYQLDNQLTSIRLIGTAGNGVVNSIDRLIVPPWLRVSMGSRPATTTATLGGNSNNNNVLARSPATEIDSSLANRQSVNLPTIGSEPLTFEQPPSARLNNPASNSFNLATDNNNNPAIDSSFEVGGAGGIGTILNRQSPFLRVANSSSVGLDTGGDQFDSSLPGGRLVVGTQQDDANLITSGLNSSTVSKNMQLIEKLATLMKQTKFVKYLFRSRLSDALKPDMNYVILVPTDQAIDKLPRQIIDMLDRDQERLGDLVNYHVLDTTFDYINTIPDGQTLNTLNEKDILFNWHKNNSILTASGAVVLGGIQEENIALLIVDRVLYPTPGNLLSIISKSPILSNFTQLVRQAKLEGQLARPGPYTLFAPSDIAFNQLDRRDLDLLQHNPETARRFLLRHLSQPAVFTSSIALSNATAAANSQAATTGRLASNGLPVPSLIISNSLGEDLTLRQRNDYFSVNEVNFAYADVAATNGVMHVIDGLL